MMRYHNGPLEDMLSAYRQEGGAEASQASWEVDLIEMLEGARVLE